MDTNMKKACSLLPRCAALCTSIATIVTIIVIVIVIVIVSVDVIVLLLLLLLGIGASDEGVSAVV